MDRTQAIVAAQALTEFSSYKGIANYLATPDPERLDQGETGRRRVASNLAWEHLQQTSWTWSEQRDILEPLVDMILGETITTVTVSGAANPGDFILLIEGHDRFGADYGRVVVAHRSYYIPDEDELDSSVEPGWWTDCREATDEERATDAFQQLQRKSDEVREAGAKWQRELDAHYERERAEAYQRIAAQGREPTREESLFIDLFSGTRDN